MNKGIWAKKDPFKSLEHHAIDVGQMCKTLLERGFGGRIAIQLTELFEDPDAPDTICLFAALHDLGKCHPYFQNEESDRRYRHEAGTQEILEKLMADEPGFNKKVCLPLIQTLRLHHQKGRCELDALIIPSNRRPRWWAEQQRLLYDGMKAIFSPDLAAISRCRHLDAACVLVWGLVILSDWLASGQAAFQEINEELDGPEYAAVSRSAADRAIDAAKLTDAALPPDGNFAAVWPGFGASLRPVQAASEALARDWRAENAPGLILIEAPMGEGKTEAAVYLATRLMHTLDRSGFYMALPTAATSNSMFFRMREFLAAHGASAPRLMHAQSWLVEEGLDGGDGEAKAWLTPRKRTMLAQYAVGTVDQAMLSVMSVRSGVLRLVGLSAKVLILDEIHAYDAYMREIIERLLSWCAALGVPVILLSATLPPALRSRFVAAYSGVPGDSRAEGYPSVTCVRRGEQPVQIRVPGSAMGGRVRVESRSLLGRNEEIADFALELTEGGGCAGIVMNTVRDAQEVFQRVREQAGEDVVCLLFHARFPLEERLAIEEKCIRWFGKRGERPRKAILVATQTVEQSIDIDLDVLVTALCPVDLLLQRIGRMWRHAETRRPASITEPRAFVLMPEGDALDGPQLAVYAPVILRRTRALLRGLEAIDLPGDIPSMVERVYDESPDPSDAQAFREWSDWRAGEAIGRSNAGVFVYARPSADKFFARNIDLTVVGDGDDDQIVRGARTRDGDNSLPVAILPSGSIRDLERPAAEEAAMALRKSFPMPSSWAQFLPEAALRPGGTLRGLTLLTPGPDDRVRLKNGKALWNKPGIGMVAD